MASSRIPLEGTQGSLQPNRIGSGTRPSCSECCPVMSWNTCRTSLGNLLHCLSVLTVCVPYIQPEHLLYQFMPIISHSSVMCNCTDTFSVFLMISTNIPTDGSKTSLLQAEQAQIPQSFLTKEILQLPINLFQLINIFPYTGGQKQDTVFQSILDGIEGVLSKGK